MNIYQVQWRDIENQCWMHAVCVARGEKEAWDLLALPPYNEFDKCRMVGVESSEIPSSMPHILSRDGAFQDLFGQIQGTDMAVGAGYWQARSPMNISIKAKA